MHNPLVPLRPIVCTIGSATYNLAKELTRILNPLTGGTSSFVKISAHFVEIVRCIGLEDKDRLVSFDVKSLFTRVPVDEALGVILTELNKDDDLEDRTMLTLTVVVRLVEISLRSTSFQYNNIYYEQREGTAMGLPLSPVIANLYMEFFEKLGIDTTPLKPKMWKRYIDDTFVVWEHGLESELTSFLEHLNSFRPSIQFTCEVEEGSKLPVQLVRNGSSLETRVYRKKTHTDRYLHYNSHHHPRVNVGTVKTLKDRPYKHYFLIMYM